VFLFIAKGEGAGGQRAQGDGEGRGGELLSLVGREEWERATL